MSTIELTGNSKEYAIIIIITTEAQIKANAVIIVALGHFINGINNRGESINNCISTAKNHD